LIQKYSRQSFFLIKMVKKSTSTCVSQSQSSKSKLSEALSELNTLNNSFVNHAHMALLVNQCVQLDALSSSFETACCADPHMGKSIGQAHPDSAGYFFYFDPFHGACNTLPSSNTSGKWTRCPHNQLTSEPYLPPASYFIDSVCISYPTTLLNTSSSSFSLVPKDRPIQEGVDTFSCEAIPVCTVSCHGPDKGIVSAVVKKCSCYGEWMAHANILQCLIGLWVFMCINVSRIWVIEGIVRIAWKKLSPKVFEYRGDCVMVEEGGGEGQEMKEKEKVLSTFAPDPASLRPLSSSLNVSLKRFERYFHSIPPDCNSPF